MKKMLTLMVLTSASLVSANQYQGDGYGYGGCSNCNGGGYNQERSYGQMSNNGWRNNQNYRNNQGQMSNDGYYDNGNNQNNNGWRNNQNNNGSRNNQNYRNNQGQMSNDGYYNNGNNQMDNNNNNGNERRDQRSNPDYEIGKKIHEKLNSGWFSKGFTGVTFRVINGDVILRGTVDTIDDKNKVEDSVKKIDGVRRINNQIMVSKKVSDNDSDSQLQDSEKKYPQDSASSNQDRQLNAKIRNKLGSGWFSNGYENLVIRTANGVVTISGSVDKEDDVKKINDQVKDIEEVRSVNNELTVKDR